MYHVRKAHLWIVLVIVAVANLLAGLGTGWRFRGREVDRLAEDRRLLLSISLKRWAIIAEQERRIEAARWCLKLSPTPVDCALDALEATP